MEDSVQITMVHIAKVETDIITDSEMGLEDFPGLKLEKIIRIIKTEIKILDIVKMVMVLTVKETETVALIVMVRTKMEDQGLTVIDQTMVQVEDLVLVECVLDLQVEDLVLVVLLLQVQYLNKKLLEKNNLKEKNRYITVKIKKNYLTKKSYMETRKNRLLLLA